MDLPFDNIESAAFLQILASHVSRTDNSFPSGPLGADTQYIMHKCHKL
jgi:hypothetical protein